MIKSKKITCDSPLPTLTAEEEKEYGIMSLECILAPLSQEERIQLGEEIFAPREDGIHSPPNQ
ncbi:MAG: hypothetical protein Q8S02_12560 [Hydrogenophaga sp.]|nr:hypothetical protein [Hydrogenophaga sp.]